MKKITFLAMVVGSAYVNSVYADDGKVYNGSSCVPFSGADGVRLSYSNIYNSSSTTNLKVDCVAVNDVIDATIKSAWIEVKDPSSTEDVSCTLTAHYNVMGETGGRLWTQARSTTGFSSSWQKLEYTGISSNSTSHYYLGCTLPKKTSNGSAYIGAYSVTEN